MKRLLTFAVLAPLYLAACHTAQTQGEPQVIVVPADEMSRKPSLGPATTATPAQAEPSPSAETTYASLPAPAPSMNTGSAKSSYTSCNVDGPYVAMTFDDGPHATLTPKLLDILKARGIKATFFVVGQNAAEYPDIVKRIVAEGHEIGNHSWSHPALTKLGSEGVRSQLDKTSNAIEQAAGIRPVVMRPPYGATNAALNKRFNDDYGMKVILWSVDPLDWKNRNATTVSSRIIQNAHPGAIILSHDIHATTVAAMPAVFDALLAKGYKFVTVSELIAMDRPPQLVKRETPAASPVPAN